MAFKYLWNTYWNLLQLLQKKGTTLKYKYNSLPSKHASWVAGIMYSYFILFIVLLLKISGVRFPLIWYRFLKLDMYANSPTHLNVYFVTRNNIFSLLKIASWLGCTKTQCLNVYNTLTCLIFMYTYKLFPSSKFVVCTNFIFRLQGTIIKT